MNNKEIILNLWYLTDASPFIHLLKAKAYVAIGSDEEKLDFLNERALLDFEVAKDYKLPSRFKIFINDEEMNAAPKSILETAGGEFQLFKEVFDSIENELSKLCSLTLSSNPLILVTPLHLINNKKVVPFESMTKKNI